VPFYILKDKTVLNAVWRIGNLMGKKTVQIDLNTEICHENSTDFDKVCHFTLDYNGNFIEIYDKFLEFTGYERKDLIGENFSSILSIKSKNLFKENLISFIKTEKLKNIPFTLILKNKLSTNVLIDTYIQNDTKNKFVRTHCYLNILSQNTKRK